MKIVILDGYALNPGDLSWDCFKELGELVIYDRTKSCDILKNIGDAEIVITNKAVIDRNIIESSNIKYIGVFATGYNVVDIEAAKEKGIVVTNVPAYSTDAVVQLTFALLFEIANKTYEHNISVKEGMWENCKDFSYSLGSLMEIKGKTMGIIGYGSIGKAVAKAANAFGINVIYNKPSGKENNDNDICHYVDIDEIFEKSDIISLHCPLNKATDKIINKDSISKMKDNVVVINTARGGVVNEEDLAQALNSGRIRAYATDVLTKEPPKKNNPLIMAKNTIITPHIAWQSYETRERLMTIACENLKGFLNGNVQNKVN